MIHLDVRLKNHMNTKTLIACLLILTGSAIATHGESPQPPSLSDKLFSLRQTVLDSGEMKMHGSLYGRLPFKDYGNWSVWLFPENLSSADLSEAKDPTFYPKIEIIVENMKFEETDATIHLTYRSVIGHGKEYDFGLSNISIKGHPTGDKELLEKLGVNLDLINIKPNQSR